MLEISTTTNILNAGFSRNTTSSSLNSDTESQSLNAFGIGQANQPEPSLSAQARILQQNEANQRELREGFQEARENSQEEQQENAESPETDTSGFVRFSSSEGSVQRNNLPAERAAEIYRSVQSLV